MNTPRPLHPGMRGLLYVASAFVLIAGLPLYVLSADTATWFAWTIDPPLTAATLGACYWAAGLLEFLGARARNWADARVAVPGVLAFTALTNLPTLQNMDSYHLDRVQAWVWIGTYLIVPPLMLILLRLQYKLPGGDPPRSAPLQPFLRLGLGLLALGFLVYGLALMLVPSDAGALWPWALNPANATYKRFTEPYLGAWLLGLGLVAAQGAWEADHMRLRPVFPAMALLGLLQAGALLRYGSVLDTSRPSAWIYLGTLLFLMVLGTVGIALRPRQS